MRLVAAVPACALILGAAIGIFLPEPRVVVSAIAVGAAWVVALAAWRARRPLPFASAVFLVFAAGGLVLGANAWRRAWRPPLRSLFDLAADARGEAFVVFEGTLRADASPTENGVSLSVDVEAVRGRDGLERQAGGVLLTVTGGLARDRVGQWRAGRRIRAPATLRRPSVYLDPGVPDNERALARRGTTLVGSVKSGALVEDLAPGSWVDEALAATRAFARRAIADDVGRWSARASAIVAAIVIGDRAGLDPDVQRKLQDAGTYHVIAISGGNIAILAGLMIGGFRLVGAFGRAAMLASIGLLAAYGALVGGGASVDRATLMAAIYFAGRAIDQRTPPLNTLAVAAALIVAADPLTVADPAFVLTFGATLGILLAAPVSERVAIAVHSWRSRLAQRAVHAVAPLFIASIAAEVMLFPVAAQVFSRVTFAGLGLNFLAIPLMAVAQVAGMVVVPLAIVSRPLAMAAGWVAAVGADGLVWSADLVRFAPFVAYRVAPPAAVAVGAYYVAGATAWWLHRRGGARVASRAAAAIAAGAAVWILTVPWSLIARRGDGRLHVTFIDVGQGDSSFVRFPNGSTLLVDAGGLSFSSAFDVGDRVVAPVVRGAGWSRLDYVALTHGDPDHIGGARSILREFRPREVWEGIPVPRSEPLTILRAMAQEGGSRWANVYAGDRLQVDGVEILARHPRAADWERQKVRNDDSLVIELRWRDVSLLLTGDIGKAVEPAIAASLPPSPLRVIKVPHHGSLTSSSEAFVSRIRPRVAVFSVGRHNHFGHPAPEVVERYRRVGAEIFRTDRDGAVTVDTDGTSLAVSAFSGHRLSIQEDRENTAVAR